MAILHCAIQTDPHGLDEDKDYRRVYRHEYFVRTSSKTVGAVFIRQNMGAASPHGVPNLWTTYSHPVTGESDTGVYLQRRTIDRVKGKDTDTLWKVACEWAPPEPGQGSTPKPSNPLNWPIQYSLEWASHSRFVEYDIDGVPIMSTAGDFFDPVEIDDARPVLVAVVNVASLPAIITQAIEFKNAVNSGTFFDAPARAAKVESITSGTVQNANDVDYYAKTIRIQFTNPNEHGLGWDLRYVNSGPHYIDSEGNRARVRVLDGDKKGQFLQKANLDADGHQLADDVPAILVPLDADPPWKLFPEKDFAGLGIGGT